MYQTVQHRLVKSIATSTNCQWLFFPGGPGIDSIYLLDLIHQLDMPGEYWLIDLVSRDYNNWDTHFLSAIKKFSNPILIGHSFGGYFPLFFPELENLLKGYIILNSVPTLEFDCSSKTNNTLPSRAPYLEKFLDTPNIDTAAALYMSGVPYCFSDLRQGTEFMKKLSFNADAGYWWHKQGAKIFSTINWIPQKLPTLIIGGENDHLTPLAHFKQDQRFHRTNIAIISIPDAGHFPWIEQPIFIKNLFTRFWDMNGNVTKTQP